MRLVSSAWPRKERRSLGAGPRENAWISSGSNAYQRFELLAGDQLELGHKVVEVLIAGVHVGLGSDGDQSIKMVNVHMHENSKESSQYLFTNRDKVLRERNVWGGRWSVSIEISQMNESRVQSPSLDRLPVFDGKISSLLICDSTQSIKFATYLGAGSAVGFLYFRPSAHRYSNLCKDKQCFRGTLSLTLSGSR